jgi:hypothetical protein
MLAENLPQGAQEMGGMITGDVQTTLDIYSG